MFAHLPGAGVRARRRQGQGPEPSGQATNQQPKTYPHPRIPAARLFSVVLCFPMFSSTWGNPEVGGGDNFWGS